MNTSKIEHIQKLSLIELKSKPKPVRHRAEINYLYEVKLGRIE